jgi:hypothetical protein
MELDEKTFKKCKKESFRGTKDIVKAPCHSACRHSAFRHTAYKQLALRPSALRHSAF